ncbi:MAG: type II secretion system F family protein, partial [Alphaproteobacteria bacterium]|nr:type II secretion system F family protein [Alphaproteobacteria bacterium]
MSPAALTLVVLAGSAAALLALLATLLLTREVRQRELSQHIKLVVSGAAGARQKRSARAGNATLKIAQRIGAAIQSSSVMSVKDIAQLERAVRSAGLPPQSAVPIIIGGKVVLVLTLPMLGYLFAATEDFSTTWRWGCILLGVAAGLFGPNMILTHIRRSRSTALRLGLTDALDLLVVCAEAGLGLESAIERVSTEMRLSNPAVAYEFLLLGQDLRLTSDRGAALMRMGERTQLDTFHRLTATLAQTLRYGTPLGQALRLLAGEMRSDRLLRLEEKAAKLPTLIMLPLGI